MKNTDKKYYHSTDTGYPEWYTTTTATGINPKYSYHRFYMKLCKLAYKKPKQIKKALKNLTIGLVPMTTVQGKTFGIIESDRDLMYWLIIGTKLLVVFSGSRKLLSWKSNLKLKKSTIPDGKTIHQGFYDQWANKFKSHVIALLLNTHQSITKIVVLGHSRGGDLATLAIRDMVKNRGISRDLVEGHSFGAAIVGNAEFVAQFDSYDIDFTMVENGFDPVCDIPMEILGFKKLYHGNTVGRRQLTQPIWHSILFLRWLDHRPNSYLKALGRI